MSKKVLIVGAGGFIGGFIATEGLKRGYDTYVAVRQSTSRRYLTDERLRFVVVDYDGDTEVERVIADNERWNYIIWNLGATKCADYRDFNRINFEYPRRFVETLRRLGKEPEKFLYISSLSAIGSYDEKDYTPATTRTIPHPNTRYGLSKMKTETYLETLPDFPYLIFRPTGVYGPHEKDYLLMIKSIDRHFDFGVGYRKQLLTFIYVEDLVGAMFDAIESDKTVRRKYIISEGRSYTQKEFRRLVATTLGRRFVIPVKLPLWLVRIACGVSEWWGSMRGKAATLNGDKYKILAQRNWACDIADAERDFAFSPKTSLADGIAATVDAYLNQK